ncbi:hypothetical protein OKW29_007452 [Paraburkholderia sp. CI3]
MTKALPKRIGERHPRIGFAADQNRRHAQTSRVERSREFELVRTRGRDEQHADHVAGERALLQRMRGRKAAKAMRGQHEWTAFAREQIAQRLRP